MAIKQKTKSLKALGKGLSSTFMQLEVLGNQDLLAKGQVGFKAKLKEHNFEE